MIAKLSVPSAAVADANGNIRIPFPSPPSGTAWQGTMTVPGATAVFSVFVAGVPWGTVTQAGAVAVQAIANETIVLIADNLPPGLQVTAWLIGTSQPVEELAAYASPGTSSPSSTVQARSSADQHIYEATMDFARRVAVSDPLPSDWIYPAGRVICNEGFEGLPVGAVPGTSSRGWRNIAGTTSIIDTNSHTGTRALQLTAAVGAGNQAAVRKRFLLLADQGAAIAAQIVVGCWFNPNLDNNWNSFHIRVLLDDTVMLADAWVQYQRRNGGATFNLVEYLGPANTTLAVQPPYNINDDDCWHYLVMVLDYRQAAYLDYSQLRMDDQNYTLPGPSAYLGGASGGVRECTVDLVLTNDSAVGTSTLLVDDFVLTDLSNHQNQP